MTPGALAPEGAVGWLRLALGLALLAAPGLAAADRLIGLRGRGWWFASVFSLSLLPLGAILLDLVLQVRTTAAVTVLLSLGWTLALLAPRLRRLARMRRKEWGAWWSKARAWRPPMPRWQALAFLAVLGFVAAAQTLPHLPGPGVSVLKAYPEFLDRVTRDGGDYPFPIHVDEHYHLAQQAAIARQGTIDIDDPYTGEPPPSPLFSVSGFRQERGFDLAMVQVHHLTGLDLTALARLVPAAESVVLAMVLYATLAPARGAWLSALFVAIVPTTVRFLGPGFLVPSAFALPWVVTALHVSLRGQGARRLAALALLETGAFFLHLVLGTVVLAVAAIATAMRKDPRRDRLVLLAVCFLPLVWVGPLVFGQVVDAVGLETGLPFQPGILHKAGWAVLLVALGGVAAAFVRHPDENAPHRVLAILGCAITVSLAWSIANDHRSDATYSRLIPTFFVCVAALAGLGLGWATHRVGEAARMPVYGTFLGVVLGLAILAPAIQFHLGSPMYRLFDGESWEDGRILAGSEADGGDLFLSDPWRAPVYNALSGARPHSVLLPGNAPVNGTDWGYYLASGGATPDWFAQRGITYVVAPVPPNAQREWLGGNVYRILPEANP